MSSTNQAALDALLGEARKAAENAYAPYSHFRVGSALLLSNGKTVGGANVENASYGLTMCAERSALAGAVSQFGPEIRVAAVAVANLNDAASPPCGACRQMLSEFVLPDATVVFPFEGEMLTMPFSEVMPVAFDLKKK
jgi:homotetrameric cytidine deaminase